MLHLSLDHCTIFFWDFFFCQFPIWCSRISKWYSGTRSSLEMPIPVQNPEFDFTNLFIPNVNLPNFNFPNVNFPNFEYTNVIDPNTNPPNSHFTGNPKKPKKRWKSEKLLKSADNQKKVRKQVTVQQNLLYKLTKEAYNIGSQFVTQP